MYFYLPILVYLFLFTYSCVIVYYQRPNSSFLFIIIPMFDKIKITNSKMEMLALQKLILIF